MKTVNCKVETHALNKMFTHKTPYKVPENMVELRDMFSEKELLQIAQNHINMMTCHKMR